MSGNEIYEKLIWQVSFTEFCHKHLIKLDFICPHCNKTNPLLSSKIRPGYCCKCQKWLGRESILPTKLNDWEVWKMNNINSLIKHFQCSSYHPIGPITSAIVGNFVTKYTDGNISAFARNFGMDISDVYDWVSGKHSISFEKLLIFSYFFNTPILDLLDLKEYNLTTINESARNLFFNRKRKREINFDPAKLRADLVIIVDNNEVPPPSMNEISKRLNYSCNRLNKYGKDLCKVIIEKRRNYLKQKKLEKREMIYLEVKRVIKELIKEGQDLTEARIRDKVSFSIFYKELYEAIERVFEELSIFKNQGICHMQNKSDE